MFKQIIENVTRNHEFNDTEMLHFTSIIERKIIPKKTLYCRFGDTINSITYVNSGLLKCYVKDRDGKEVILYFPKEDWWVADVNSFYFRGPSNYQFETIEDSELLTISYENLHHLFQMHPKFESAFHDLLKRYVISCNNRYLTRLTINARERYEMFAEKHPDLVQRVPQKSIASFLGITPEFLSKMRSEK